jgi:hypothetical protein
MPRPYIWTWEQRKNGIGSLSVKPPMDSVDPAVEKDEQADPYREDWGMYAFLYESEKSLAMGGLLDMMFLGGGSNPWSPPNTELVGVGGGTAGAPGAPGGGAPVSDFLDGLCTEANISASEYLQEFCANASLNDGCREVKTILPLVDQVLGSQITGIRFPTGHTMSVTTFAEGFCFGNFGQVILRIDIPGGGGVTCNDYFFSQPTNATFDATGHAGPYPCGQSSVRVASSIGVAMTTALQCLKDFFGGDFTPLGCTP